MMNRRTITTVIGLFCLFTAATATAQPRWGRERQPQTGACFYEDINFRGRYFCVREGERIPSLPAGLGDKVSSIRLLGAAEVTVFRDSDMRGRSGRFINDVRNLKRDGWNDQISSVEVARPRDYSGFGGGDRGRARGNRDRGGWRGDQTPVWGRTEQMPREGACFYEDKDFRGMYFCAPRGAVYTSLPRGFNDRISSVRVFGADVRIFQNQNFGGRSTEIRSDTPNLRGNWRDNVSSLRVF
jgi:peptidase inhibitor family I36